MFTPNSTRQSVYLLLAAWILLAVLFGLYDLQVSQAVVDRQAKWAQCVENYGEMPGIFIMVAAVYGAYTMRQRSQHKGKELAVSLLALAGTAFALYLLAGWALFRYFPEFVKSYSNLLLPAFVVLLAVQRLLKKAGNFPLVWSKACSVTIWLALINVVAFVQGFKSFWGRVRFRDLAPDYANFTPWYLPGAGGGESFPSGHTALGWMLLPLLLLTIPCSRKIKILVGLLVIGWGVLVPVGRVVIGAHYASDTLFASGVAILSFLLLTRNAGTWK